MSITYIHNNIILRNYYVLGTMLAFHMYHFISYDNYDIGTINFYK